MWHAFENAYERVLHAYERSLTWVMNHRVETLAFSFVTLVLTGYLFYAIPKGLFPSDDTGQLTVTTEAAEGVSYDALIAHQQEVAAIMAKDPEVAVGTGVRWHHAGLQSGSDHRQPEADR